MKGFFERMNSCVKPGAKDSGEQHNVDEVMATVKIADENGNIDNKVCKHECDEGSCFHASVSCERCKDGRLGVDAWTYQAPGGPKDPLHTPACF